MRNPFGKSACAVKLLCFAHHLGAFEYLFYEFLHVFQAPRTIAGDRLFEALDPEFDVVEIRDRFAQCSFGQVRKL